jgi:phosphatidylglycerol---prolipoprotein diacylglyceryl transferase
MCPRLFQIGPFTVYGYGLMLALGFIAGSYLLVSEFKRRKIDPNIANNITLTALIAGVAGSKILFLLENWPSFIADPFGMAFNPGGLTFYGGLILAAFSIYIYGKKKGISFFTIGDAIAPGMMLGYGIGRLGCHLAGDGDYGFPTLLPWGTNYSKGTYPPSLAFKDFPEITSRFPGGIVPNNIPCHPTPVYEFIICVLMCWFLWRVRKEMKPAGKLFMIYLSLAGIERFFIEFLRPNPRVVFNLTEAQLIAMVLIAIGLFGWWKFAASSHVSNTKV